MRVSRLAAFLAPLSTAIPPPNDACPYAVTVIVNAPFITSNNVDASADLICGVPGTQAGGVFYSFEGTGNVMTVSTCGSSTNFPTNITVSTECGGKCIPNDNPGFPVICSDSKGNGRTVTFDSELGTTYRTMVSGRTFLDSGVFNFNVTDRPAPVNDLCEDAEELVVSGYSSPVYKAGTTLNATKDNRCNKVTGRGVWCKCFRDENESAGLLV